MSAISHEYVPPALEDYPWIRAWYYLGTHDFRDMAKVLEQARAWRAPSTATHWLPEGTWALLEDIRDAQTRQEFIDYAYDQGIPLPERVVRRWAVEAVIQPVPQPEEPDPDDLGYLRSDLLGQQEGPDQH